MNVPFAVGDQFTTTNGKRLTIRGFWAFDPEIAVAETDAGKTVHVYPTGYCPNLGRECWVSEAHRLAFYGERANVDEVQG